MKEAFVSIVIVESRTLEEVQICLAKIVQTLSFNYSDYEVIVVGNHNKSMMSKTAEKVLERIPCIRYIQLASEVQTDIAWAAGIENAIGDFVVMFSLNQDPVEVIPAIIEKSYCGFDIVVGVDNTRKPFLYRSLRALARLVLKRIDYSLPKNATRLQCLSRRAVNTITSVGGFHQQLVMRIQKTGYAQATLEYACIQNNSKCAIEFIRQGLSDLLYALVFNSSIPLRWMSLLGFIGSASAFLFSCYSVLVRLIKDDVVEGWTTTVLFMSALFCMQFVMLAFFGEYLGRLLNERVDQAAYSVVSERNSRTMLNRDRFNVMETAVVAEVNRVQTGRNA